ncbi:MAG TPA: signal peptidase II [Thermoleophilaceae bacterium]
MTGWVLAGAGVIVALDQATKSLAVRLLAPAGVAGARAAGVFRLATNEGSWLGRGPAVPALLGLWTMTLACTVLVLATASPSGGLAGAGLVVALGGATSNLLDRVGRGAVIDFIALGWWPAFNLADVAIVSGVAVAIGSVV